MVVLVHVSHVGIMANIGKSLSGILSWQRCQVRDFIFVFFAKSGNGRDGI